MSGIILKSLITLSGFSIPIVKGLFIWLDGVIYKIAYMALSAFFEIIRLTGNITEYGTEISAVMRRVMVLVGIFALFRLAIMLINYIMNPEKAKDASGNGQKIVKNVVLAFVMLILSPIVFSQMFKLQHTIIDSNVIPNIIYGTGSDYNVENQTKAIVNDIFLVFFSDNGECENTNSGECSIYNNVATGNSDVETLVGLELSNKFTYIPVISGIIGCLLVYYFAVFAIEMAIRLLKLLVLQVLSPIPIIMSVDPSQKDRLSKFFKLYISIWLQAFIRIITIYLAFVVCSFIVNTFSENLKTLGTVGAIVKVLLIIGIFKGAKDLPKLIDEALGTKIASDVHGKPFGAALAGVVGGGIGLVGGAIAGGLAGGAGGAVTGAMSGITSGATGLMGAKNAGAAVGAAVKSIKGGYGSGLTTAAAGGLAGFAGGKVTGFTGRNAKIDREASKAQSKVDAYKNFKEAVMNSYAKDGKAGKKENDSRVLAAYANRENYLRQRLSKSEMEERMKDALANYNEYISSGHSRDDAQSLELLKKYKDAESDFANYDENEKATLAALTKEIKDSEDAYESRAFEWFNSEKLGGGDASKASEIAKNYNNPKLYPSLTEAERAYFELTRENGGKDLLPTDGNSFEEQFKANKKEADKSLSTATAKQKGSKYLNEKAANGK